jgi:hypothetical protein
MCAGVPVHTLCQSVLMPSAAASSGYRQCSRTWAVERLRLSHDGFTTSACARGYLFSPSVSLY